MTDVSEPEPGGMDLLVNIDVPDLAAAIAFYTSAFDIPLE